MENPYLIELARRNLFDFMTYMFPFPVKWNWHHKYVCDILQQFAEGKYDRLMIFMPPQHQKTTMMTEYLTAWNFGRNPDSQTMLIMYDAPMAQKYNRKIQRIIDTDKYREIFPNTRLNESNVVTNRKGSYVRNSKEFEIVDRIGFFKSVGVGGGIAGNPAKLALLDDVIKNFAEANSQTYRDATYNWYTDELEARLHNDSKVAFTITRRHEDDLAGRLLERDGIVEEGGEWKVITIPVIKEDDSNPDDPRKIGEVLFPELHSLSRMLKIKEKSPRTFTGLYQQRPSPVEGDKIKRAWFEIIEKSQLPTGRVEILIDGAYTKNTQNDPTGLMAVIHHDRIIYIILATSKHLEMPQFLKYFDSFSKSVGHDNGVVRIEPKATGHTVEQLLFEKGYNVSLIEGEIVRMSKEERVDGTSPYMESGRIKLLKGAWNSSFLDQLAQFPNGKHDEYADLLPYAIDQYLMEDDTPAIYHM